MPVLRLRDLEVRFPGLDRPALGVPALDLDQGEHVALTGPSGCGKSTFVNVVTGLEAASRGAVVWDGTDLAKLSQSARDRWRADHVGLVMQEFHLFPGLSAVDNVLLPRRLRRLRLEAGAASRAASLLDRVGITRHRQKVETLSRGQMQRVAVARALLGRPAVLVADEPTASLDADAGRAVADLLLELASETGVTLIVATHDRRLDERMNRRLVMESGLIARDEPIGPRREPLPIPA